MEATRTWKATRSARPAALSELGDQHRKALKWVWVLLTLSLAFRFCYTAMRQLVADEAVYWSWSRHPATGYLDHPPMIVYLIKASPPRCSASTSSASASSARCSPPPRWRCCCCWPSGCCASHGRSLWVGIIWLTSPLLAGLGTIATPDTPATFFSLCALSCVLLLFTGEQRQSVAAAASAQGARPVAGVRRVLRAGLHVQVHDRPAPRVGGAGAADVASGAAAVAAALAVPVASCPPCCCSRR